MNHWGLGPIPNPQSPIPNPQSPIPNPQSPIPNLKLQYILYNNKYLRIQEHCSWIN